MEYVGFVGPLAGMILITVWAISPFAGSHRRRRGRDPRAAADARSARRA